MDTTVSSASSVCPPANFEDLVQAVGAHIFAFLQGEEIPPLERLCHTVFDVSKADTALVWQFHSLCTIARLISSARGDDRKLLIQKTLQRHLMKQQRRGRGKAVAATGASSSASASTAESGSGTAVQVPVVERQDLSGSKEKERTAASVPEGGEADSFLQHHTEAELKPPFSWKEVFRVFFRVHVLPSAGKNLTPGQLGRMVEVFRFLQFKATPQQQHLHTQTQQQVSRSIHQTLPDDSSPSSSSSSSSSSAPPSLKSCPPWHLFFEEVRFPTQATLDFANSRFHFADRNWQIDSNLTDGVMKLSLASGFEHFDPVTEQWHGEFVEGRVKVFTLEGSEFGPSSPSFPVSVSVAAGSAGEGTTCTGGELSSGVGMDRLGTGTENLLEFDRVDTEREREGSEEFVGMLLWPQQGSTETEVDRHRNASPSFPSCNSTKGREVGGYGGLVGERMKRSDSASLFIQPFVKVVAEPSVQFRLGVYEEEREKEEKEKEKGAERDATDALRLSSREFSPSSSSRVQHEGLLRGRGRGRGKERTTGLLKEKAIGTLRHKRPLKRGRQMPVAIALQITGEGFTGSPHCPRCSEMRMARMCKRGEGFKTFKEIWYPTEAHVPKRLKGMDVSVHGGAKVRVLMAPRSRGDSSSSDVLQQSRHGHGELSSAGWWDGGGQRGKLNATPSFSSSEETEIQDSGTAVYFLKTLERFWPAFALACLQEITAAHEPEGLDAAAWEALPVIRGGEKAEGRESMTTLDCPSRLADDEDLSDLRVWFAFNHRSSVDHPGAAAAVSGPPGRKGVYVKVLGTWPACALFEGRVFWCRVDAIVRALEKQEEEALNAMMKEAEELEEARGERPARAEHRGAKSEGGDSFRAVFEYFESHMYKSGPVCTWGEDTTVPRVRIFGTPQDRQLPESLRRKFLLHSSRPSLVHVSGQQREAETKNSKVIAAGESAQPGASGNTRRRPLPLRPKAKPPPLPLKSAPLERARAAGRERPAGNVTHGHAVTVSLATKAESSPTDNTRNAT
uniref:Uncharacterized protein n=1 Tax=Chromera velia CCMP2878 TaxID=1169474 RepID=A0A0G4FBV2_9ALVE|eukprot:Cvel_16210.t1-p1 / transcript=Cvel_16210.t1 / gene=Cvel_16210 / organism=Chromera_velia_CCMP2878 / gene_product=hypothetical protein / transcript_product=hypothetical protein / location=Cvel_scaffold1238:41967-48127(-) / protein_length=1016 / sequence_SO=supercontig / SO=protein_coding / is_pseudo=false